MAMAMETCEAYDFTVEVPEVDCALLMELLEEPNSEAGDFVDEYDKDCILEDILSDFDGRDCTKSSVNDVVAIEDPLDWELMEMEMEMETVANQDIGGGWYMDEQEVFVCEEQKFYHEDCFHLNGESLIEQIYIPLWQ